MDGLVASPPAAFMAARPGPAAAPEAGKARPWPSIREELRLYPASPGLGGEPSWTLHDPVSQRFFRLGWLEVEIINRWHLGSPEAIAAAVTRETTLTPGPPMVEAVEKFLLAHELSVANSPGDVARLAEKRHKKKPLLMTVLKSYLFIRVPLLKPDAFLARSLPRVRPLFSTAALLCLLLAALLGLYLISLQWSEFRDSFASLLSFEGGIMVALALAFSKCFHELGHAYAAKSLGLKVPSMGVSLMCFAPVLWTDTTEAWKLAQRRDRLFIGVAGVYAELWLAVTAALLWPILPPGALKTAAFLTASSTWLLTLAVNINPFMRYDGYYLLSDYWNIPGLQGRSFALAKWWLREQLFALELPPPERMNPRDRGKLIIYAYLVWVYRFFLFLGIALLVYHLFFKALGALLMAVELVFFLALPICREVGAWVKLRDKMRLNGRTLRSALLFFGLLLLFVWPWHDRVQGPGMLFAEHQAFYFAPTGGVVEDCAADGSEMETGQVLFRLRSPDLDSRILVAEKKVEMQRRLLSSASLDAALRAEMASDWEELERLVENLAGLLAQREELTMRADFDGMLTDVPPWLREESWVSAKEGLGILVGGGSLVAAYVSEADWSRIRKGDSGLFYPSGSAWKPLPLELVRVEGQAVTELIYPELASLMGGPLPVHKDPQGRLVPERAVYRVLCRVQGVEAYGRFLVGQVTLEASPRSFISLVWHNLVGLLVRESSW